MGRVGIPAWVTPPAVEVDDLRWLAYCYALDRGFSEFPAAAGMIGAIDWVWGDRTGPITAREEQPVTRALADAELWAAIAVDDIHHNRHLPPLDLICAKLGVVNWPVQSMDPG